MTTGQFRAAAQRAQDRFATALAEVNSALAREVACDVVIRLEQSAGAFLGPTDHDSTVLLQRRAARAMALLERAGALPPDGVLFAMADDLLDPSCALQRAAAAMRHQ